MKNNLIYSVILIGLLTFTYFFQELKERERFRDKDQKEILLNQSEMGPLKGFKIGSVEIIKKGEEFFLSKTRYLVSKERVAQVFNILSGLRVEKILPLSNKGVIENKKLFFPESLKEISFIFKKDNFKFILGHKLEFSQSFYFRVEKKGKIRWGIAKDVSDFKALYQKNSYERSPKRYNRLSNILSIKSDFFKETKVLSGDQLNLNKIKVASLKKNVFTIDLKEKRTDPSKFEGLDYSFNKMNDLLNFKARSIEENYNVKDLEKRLSQINLIFTDKKNKRLTLYGRYRGEKGLFLTQSGIPYLYHLEQKDITLFFTTVQDFWDLRLEKNFHSLNPKDFSLHYVGPHKKKTILTYKSIKDIRPFFLKRPDRVSLLSHKYVHNMKEFLSMEGHNLTFIIFKKQEDLVFWNKKSGIGYYFWIGNNPLAKRKFSTLLLGYR